MRRERVVGVGRTGWGSLLGEGLRRVGSGGPETVAVAGVQGVGEERQTAGDGEEERERERERENSGLQKFRRGGLAVLLGRGEV